MSARNPDKCLVFSVLELLKQLSDEHAHGDNSVVVDAESLGVAQDCLSSAFGLSLDDESDRAEYSAINHTLLRTLFKQALRLAPSKPSAPAPAPAPLKDDPPLPTDDPRFKSYLQLLSKRGYFEGAVEGTPEYQEKYAEALKKYQAAQAQKEAVLLPSGTAEEWKNKGNALLTGSPSQPKEAIEAYNNAILLDGSNAIYFANRALAHINLAQYAEAVDDAKAAIAIQPSSLKSYTRLAQAYEALGQYDLALSEAYEPALLLEPDNVSIQRQAEAARSLVQSRASSGNPFADPPSEGAPAQAPAGRPDLGALAGMFGGGAGGGGGMPDLSSLLSDPSKMQDRKSTRLNSSH